MAELQVSGIEGLMLSLKELEEIPDDVKDEMLNAGADVVVPALKAKIVAYGILDTGTTERSIKKGKPKNAKGGGRVIYVNAVGSRTRGKNEKTTTRNAEILFLNEFGTKKIKARPAVRDSAEESAEAVERAQADIYDKYLKSKDL